MVDPLADRSNMRKPVQSVKVLSVDGLKKALRFALHSPNMFIAFAVIGSYANFFEKMELYEVKYVSFLSVID